MPSCYYYDEQRNRCNCYVNENLNELLAENAKLREQIDAAHMSRLLTENENESLRELVWDMWQFTGAACKKYPRLFDHFAPGGQMVKPNMIDAFEQRMSDLGIEVPE